MAQSVADCDGLDCRRKFDRTKRRWKFQCSFTVCLSLYDSDSYWYYQMQMLAQPEYLKTIQIKPKDGDKAPEIYYGYVGQKKGDDIDIFDQKIDAMKNQWKKDALIMINNVEQKGYTDILMKLIRKWCNK